MWIGHIMAIFHLLNKVGIGADSILAYQIGAFLPTLRAIKTFLESGHCWWKDQRKRYLLDLDLQLKSWLNLTWSGRIMRSSVDWICSCGLDVRTIRGGGMEVGFKNNFLL